MDNLSDEGQPNKNEHTWAHLNQGINEVSVLVFAMWDHDICFAHSLHCYILRITRVGMQSTACAHIEWPGQVIYKRIEHYVLLHNPCI